MSVFQRPFLDMLAELRRGRVAADLTEATHDLIAKCIDTGKKGSITVTLTFEPDKDTDDERFKVSDQVTVKAPRRTVKPSIFYITDDGNLTRTDPRQEAFEGLREVPATKPESTDEKKAKAN